MFFCHSKVFFITLSFSSNVTFEPYKYFYLSFPLSILKSLKLFLDENNTLFPIIQFLALYEPQHCSILHKGISNLYDSFTKLIIGWHIIFCCSVKCVIPSSFASFEPE